VEIEGSSRMMAYVICERCIDVKDIACVDGCSAEDDVPEEWESFIEKNAEFFVV